MQSSRFFTAVCGMWIIACVAQAQVTWIGGNITTPGFGLPANWSGPLPNDGTVNAIFSGTVSPAPVIDANFSINTLYYSSGVPSFTLSGTSTLTILSSLTNASGKTQTISAPLALGPGFSFIGSGSGQSFITSTGGLTASGDFSLTSGVYLTQRNGWNVTGNVTIGAALDTVLEFQTGVTANNAFVNQGTLFFNSGTATSTVNGVISGAGALNVFSPVTLNAANTYAGTTTVGSTLTLGTANALPTSGRVSFSGSAALLLVNQNQTIGSLISSGGSGDITIAAGRTLTIGSGAGLTYSGAVTGAGSLAVSSGAQNFTGALTHAGGTAIAGGQLNVGDGGASGTLGGNVTVASGATLGFNRADASSFSGAISGAGNVVKNGAGVLTLSGASSYTGLTSIFDGTIRLGASGALPAATSVLFPATAGVGLDLNGFNQTVASLSGAGGSVALGSGTLTIARDTLADTFDGVISGAGAIVKAGTGTQHLGGANTYTGGTTIDAGTIALTNASGSGLGAGSVTIASGATLAVGNGGTGGAVAGNIAASGTVRFDRSDNATYAGVLSGAGLFEKQGAGRLTLTGANTFTGNTTVNNGTLQIGNGGAAGSLGGNVMLFGGNLEFNRTDAHAFTGAISGAGSVTQLGGTLSLSGTHTYSGPTLIAAGNFTAGAANAFSANSTLRPNSGALVQVTSSQIAGGLENYSAGVAGNVTLASGTVLTLNRADNAGILFSGTISGGGALAIAGFGPQVLGAAHTYTGGTTLTGGTLRLDVNNALPVGGNVTFSTGSFGAATLDLQGRTQTIGALLFTGASGGSGASVLLGGGTLTVNGPLSFDAASSPGGATISGGTLVLGSANRTLTVGDSNNAFADLTIAATVSAAGATLTKAGSGTLILSGASNHAATIINDGTLRLEADHVLPAGGNVTINGTASSTPTTLDLGDRTQAIGALTLGGAASTGGAVVSMGTNGALTLGGDVTFNAANNPAAGIFGGTLALGGATRTFNVGDSSLAFSDLSISAAITGTGGITKTGAGTLVLSGANTYNGTTTINGGRLLLSGGSLPANGAVVINATAAGGSATLDLSSSTSIGTLTFGGTGATSTSANSVIINGTLTLTGGIIYSAANPSMPGAQISGSALQLDTTQVFNIGDATAQDDLAITADIQGAGGLTKTGAGTLLLANGASGFAGPVAVQEGVLAVSSLGTIGVNSSLGSGSSAIALGNGATGVTLRYTGNTTATTDRPLDLAGTTGGATLEVSSGMGAVSFLGNITASGAGSKTLTLFTSSNAPSKIGGAITDNSATNRTAVLKTGVGTWILSGANTYTGGTSIGAGTLQLAANNALPAGGDVVINATSGKAVLNVNHTTQSIGALTLGGAGGGSLASNLLILGSSGTLTLGGNLTYNGANNGSAYIAAAQPFSGANPLGGTLSLGNASRTFAIGNSSVPVGLTIFSNISGGAGVDLTKTGDGSLTLAGQGAYLGNTTIASGTLLLAASSTESEGSVISGPVGRGALILQNGATLTPTAIVTPAATLGGDITLRNAVALAHNVTLGSVLSDGDSTLTLSGTVTATDAATTWHLGGETPVILSGTLNAASSATALTVDSGGRGSLGRLIIGAVVGSNVASLTADRSAIIFASAPSLTHTAAVNVANNGYVGVGATGLTPPPAPAALIARIANPATFTGTIGFDTDLGALGLPHEFAGTTAAPIDFSAFGSGLTIGSTTAAILSGALLPASNGYQFGNGGGMLVVRSDLANGGTSRGVNVTSNPAVPESALTTIFEGSNTYSGNLGVTHSLAVLNSPLALPAASSIHLGAGGYAGYTERFTGGGTPGTVSFRTFISRLGSYTPTSVIGLDSSDYLASLTSPGTMFSGSGVRFISETLDLSSLSSIYLGTTTHTLVAAPVFAPNQGGANRILSLLAAGDGLLMLGSPLGPANVSQLVVGQNTSQLGRGSVGLAAGNTYTGGTTLLSGSLLLFGSSRTSGSSIVSGPLGTGPLTVGSGALGANLQVEEADSNQPVLHNAINLGSTLQIGVPAGESGGSSGAVSLLSDYPNLILHGIVADLAGAAGALTLYSGVTLNGANTYTGGTTLHNGVLTLGHDSALGAGALTISPLESGAYPLALNIANGSRTIANNLVLNGFTDLYLPVTGNGSLTVNGAVTLNSGVMLAPENYPILLNGAVSGAGRLTLDGANRLFLNGANTYTGGTRATDGAIVFGSAGAIPSGAALLIADSSGYIGIATPTANLQGDFLDRFNKGGTTGTIGFDTPPGATTNVFSGNINLAGFGFGTRLGSATTATLTGTITPSGTAYLFGGGGGLLQVNSPLTDGPSIRDLHLFSSHEAPLTLRLGGANTFTGSILVNNSGLIFRPGALPGGSNLIFTSEGYIGTEDTALSPGSFLGRFSPSSTNSIIGFDSFTGSPYTLASGTTVDLASVFTSGDPRIFLGTASNAVINGTINLPGGQTNYLFAGYKGGQLTVGTVLTGARAVEIGDTDIPATFGTPMDYTAPRSHVTLTGANSHTLGTLLNAGVLSVGHDSALGSGTLTVAANDFGPLRLGLLATGGPRALNNPIVLLGDLDVGGDSLSLAGAISGAGELYKSGSGTLTLSGSNTFSGGIYIAQGTVNFASATAAGSGPVRLGTAAGATAAFQVSTTINGISASHSSDTLQIGSGAPLTGVTLTINQTFDGEFLGSITGAGAVVYRGPVASEPYRLRLAGANSYTGASTINSGIVLAAGHSSALGAGPITLGGGTLEVESGITLTNSFSFASGTLGGAGTLRPSNGVIVGAGAKLAPGLDTIGTLSFDGAAVTGPILTLASGGLYHWQLVDALANGDMINVAGAAAVTGTSGTPFTLRITAGGALDLLSVSTIANFNPGQSYSWTVLNATGITGFTPGSVQVDWSGISGYTAGGTFAVSLNGAGTGLMLNFTPIPEPSTYVLLSLGAAMVFFGVRRRRR